MNSKKALVETKAELDKKIRKAGWVANSVMYLGFGGFFVLVAEPVYHYNVSQEVMVVTLTLFAVTVAAVNLTIYRYYKQQMPKGGV
jgi:hypothetical protein